MHESASTTIRLIKWMIGSQELAHNLSASQVLQTLRV